MKFISNIYWYIKKKKLKFKTRGKHIEICGKFDFFNSLNISMGDYIYIGPNSKIWGIGEVTIKNNVIIGPNVTIMTSNHKYDSEIAIPYDFSNIRKDVIIEDNVWIGANVNIIPGVRIKEGAVIGMGSVVTKDVDSCAIVGGNPAKVIKFRDKEKYEKLKIEGKFYLKIKNSSKKVTS